MQVDLNDRFTLVAHYTAPRQDVLASLGAVLQHIDIQEDRAHFLPCVSLRWEIERSTDEVVFLGRTLDLGELGRYRFESTLGLTYAQGMTTLSRVISLSPSEMTFFQDLITHLDRIWNRVRLGQAPAVPEACAAPPVYLRLPPVVETTSAWRMDRPGGPE